MIAATSETEPSRRPALPNGIYRIEVAKPMSYMIAELVRCDDFQAVFDCRIPDVRRLTLPVFDLGRAEYLADNWHTFVTEARTSEVVDPLWSFESYQKEIRTLAELVADEVIDMIEEEDSSSADDIRSWFSQFCKEAILDSEWYTTEPARAAVTEFANSRYDVLPKQILSLVPRGREHDWRQVQKAACYAYMRADVKEEFKRSLRRRIKKKQNFDE